MKHWVLFTSSGWESIFSYQYYCPSDMNPLPVQQQGPLKHQRTIMDDNKTG